MKLFYFQRRDGMSNFGDDLNAWLWPQLLPGLFDDDETTVFIGIGTLLNHLLPQRVPNAKKLLIFGTGAGYGQPLTAIKDRCQIYCLRGKLSARQLNQPEKLAITDGAVLVRRLFQPSGKKTSRFSFMPHIHHAKFAGPIWQDVCARVGFGYIDPSWPVEKVLDSISQTEVILAEAMHGAIVADALRVPWIPVVTSPRISSFKWQDWCSSLELAYHPYYLPPLLGSYPRFDNRRLAHKHWENCVKQEGWLALCQLLRARQSLWAKQLLRITQVACPNLSSQGHIERLTVELESQLDRLKKDCLVSKSQRANGVNPTASTAEYTIR